MMTTNQMIYVHIPFCNRKCFYCGFVSVNKKQLWEQYFKKLEAEIIERKNNILVSSIYFGGGTPSVVDFHYIEKCMKLIKNCYNISPNAEITMEANPTEDFVKNIDHYKQMGFNRISFGVQSLDENKLAKIGRNQKTKQALDCIKSAVNIFDNVSTDLLIGLENQTQEEVINDINILRSVGVKHFSVYMLMIEDGTVLKPMVDKKLYFPLEDDKAVKIYDSVFKYLMSVKIERYEISNFAFEGYHSKHNLGYWQMKNYLGFGASAHSFEGNKRFFNSNDLNEYISNNIVTSEILSQQELHEEKIMLGLRTIFGVDKNEIKNKTQLQELLNLGFVKEHNNNISICDKHFAVANQIILKLI